MYLLRWGWGTNGKDLKSVREGQNRQNQVFWRFYHYRQHAGAIYVLISNQMLPYCLRSCTWESLYYWGERGKDSISVPKLRGCLLSTTRKQIPSNNTQALKIYLSKTYIFPTECGSAAITEYVTD